MSHLQMQIEDLILPAPLQFRDNQRVTLSVNDYAASSTGRVRLDRGFNLKGDTAGDYQVITLAQFRRKLLDMTNGVVVGDAKKPSDGERNDILQAIAADPDEGKISIRLEAGKWNLTPLVFIEKTALPANPVDIGII